MLLISYMCPYSLEINISSSFFCTSGKETVAILKISRRQLAPCQENRIKRQQTVSSTRCKVLVPNAGFLMASMPSSCRFKPTEFSYSQSVSVFVPQDKVRGSAIPLSPVAIRLNWRLLSQRIIQAQGHLPGHVIGMVRKSVTN